MVERASENQSSRVTRFSQSKRPGGRDPNSAIHIAAWQSEVRTTTPDALGLAPFAAR